MIKLDDDLLQELGLSALPAEEKKKLLGHIYETLEMRVGMKLAEQMSDAQLSEFEQFINRNDEAGALQWLEANFPNYRDVVASEFEILKREIGHVAPQILSASTAGPTDNSQQPAPGAPGQQYAPGPPPAQPMMPPQQYQQYGQNQPNYGPMPGPATPPPQYQQPYYPGPPGPQNMPPQGGQAPQQPQAPSYGGQPGQQF